MMRHSRRRPLLVGIGLALGGGLAAAVPSGLPPMKVFTARDVGVATTAWSETQDADGLMYFGCNTVVSFNGDHWRAQEMDSTYLVRGLDAGPDGRIWTGGVNQIGWFARNDTGNLDYHTLVSPMIAGSQDPGEVWRAYADGPGRAYFVAQDRVLHWDGRSMTTWSLPGQNLLWSCRTPHGIYVHYPPRGLLRLDPQGPILVAPASVLGPTAIRWLDDSGPDWTLLTTQGFARLRRGRVEPLTTAASGFVRAFTPTAMARLPNGLLAIGTLQGGIGLVDSEGKVRQILDQSRGLPSNQIYSLFVDHAGALWGGGPAYIVRLGFESGTSLYTEHSGYPAGGADSLTISGGSLYVAAHDGLRRLEEDSLRHNAYFGELPFHSNRLYSVAATSSGLVVGTLSGLARVAERGLRPFRGIPEAVFRTHPSLAHPGLVLASLRDRVLLVDPVAGTSETIADGLPDYGDSIADEISGRLWIGTPSRGLFFALPAQPHAVPAGPAFGPLPGAGPAYVATSGFNVLALTKLGAFVLGPKAGRFEAVANGPKGTPVGISNVGNQGDFWGAIDVGGEIPRLGRLEGRGDHWDWAPVSVEGLPDVGSILGLYLERDHADEELWIAGTQALLRTNVAELASRPPPPPTVRLWHPDGADTVRLRAGTRLPFAQRHVHAAFESMDFGRRDPDRFETMLEGAESEWEPPDQSPVRDLAGLQEGRYRLRVRSVSETGERGPESAVDFSIDPPWWRSTPTHLGEGLALLLAGGLLVRLRTRALRSRAVLLEQMVRRRTAELERANAAKTEFVASMSHEIRNPMGGILSSALQLRDSALSAEQTGLVATLSSCAQFLSKLVEDVLDFAALESGGYQVTFAPFAPRELLETVVVMLRPVAGGHLLQVHVDQDIPPAIVGDGGRIQQILVNFTTNALKFGGPTIQLSVRLDGAYCIFAVADDGPGISVAEQEFLFARFSRLKAARNSALPGAGLGLAVSRELAKRMGGSVGVSSQEGKGALFFLRIPLREEALGPSPEAHRGHALVVEDVAYNARALVFMLNRLGYSADTASSGSQALLHLGQGAYDAVFVDCDVPEIGGIELARRIRAAASTRRSLIIATTALTTPENEQACRRAGMDRFIAKPVTPEKLRRALTGECFEEPRPAPEPGLDLSLLSHLTDGNPKSLKVELAKYRAALAESLAAVQAAQGRPERRAVASNAHRVLSLARLVNAARVADAARDLQDYAAVYSAEELAAELANLAGRGDELIEQIEATLNAAPGA